MERRRTCFIFFFWTIYAAIIINIFRSLHSISTILSSSLLLMIVKKEGKLFEEGRHDDILETKSVSHSIFLFQLSWCIPKEGTRANNRLTALTGPLQFLRKEILANFDPVSFPPYTFPHFFTTISFHSVCQRELKRGHHQSIEWVTRGFMVWYDIVVHRMNAWILNRKREGESVKRRKWELGWV